MIDYIILYWTVDQLTYLFEDLGAKDQELQVSFSWLKFYINYTEEKQLGQKPQYRKHYEHMLPWTDQATLNRSYQFFGSTLLSSLIWKISIA